MAFYDDMAATSGALVDKFGQNVTFERRSPGAYDPATGTTPLTTTRWTGPGILKLYTQGLIDGTRITAQDRELVTGPLDTRPQNGDLVIVNGDVLEIIMVSENNPAGVPLGFSLQVRA